MDPYSFSSSAAMAQQTWELENNIVTMETPPSSESNAIFYYDESAQAKFQQDKPWLENPYKDYYWCMMEELKLKSRKYYWEYGKSPYQENDSVNEADAGRNGDELGLEFGNDSSRCAVHGCKSKAMALTKFCHAHILSDSKQKLYMGCNYVIKRYDFC